MITTSFTGSLYNVGPVTTLAKSSRKVQRIRFQVNPQPDRLGRITEAVNYFDVFTYGDDIDAVWKNHNPNLPTPTATVIVQLVGRLRLDQQTATFYNNVTLRLLKITWNYDKDERTTTGSIHPVQE